VVLTISEGQDWLSQVVWLDYKLAVALAVIAPLLLLGWAALVRLHPLVTLMIIYWRVSSLLAVTVYLMIAEFPVSFMTGTTARALIPACLWFWDDLSQGILLAGGSLSRIFRWWRWLVTGYMGAGFLLSLGFLPCAFQQQLDTTCRAWLEPPLMFRQIFHPTIPVETLGLAGILGLLAYVLYSLYFGWRLRRGDFDEDPQ
jgi:hypothetical protein